MALVDRRSPSACPTNVIKAQLARIADCDVTRSLLSPALPSAPRRGRCVRPKVKEKKVHAGTGRWALTPTQYTTLHSTILLYTFLVIVIQFASMLGNISHIYHILTMVQYILGVMTENFTFLSTIHVRYDHMQHDRLWMLLNTLICSVWGNLKNGRRKK